MELAIVILAAGHGSRMHSPLPKVLHEIGGTSMLTHVIETAKTLEPASITIVYGQQGELLKQSLQPIFDQTDSPLAIHWVHQQQQLGTGHAVEQSLPHLKQQQQILVLYGDVPLISSNTLKRLLYQPGFAILTAHPNDPSGYGRIIKNSQGFVSQIIEHKDANEQQLQVKEINTGIMCLPAKTLHAYIDKIANNNSQQEYYLTDLVHIVAQAGQKITAIQTENIMEVQGINSLQQLALMERYFQIKQADALMAQGVRLMDPNRLDIRGQLTAEAGVIIDFGNLFEGQVTLGAGTYIEPNCVIRNSVVGSHVHIKSHSVIDQAIIENQCSVGPFARLRPGACLREQASVGNFVEIKKSEIGQGSKVGHLSYLGDAHLGAKVNIGAGTITCNYDGANKHRTRIDDGAFIGSGTQLVAPIHIEQQAVLGAGTTLTATAPAGKLTLSRTPQLTIENWVRPVKLKT